MPLAPACRIDVAAHLRIKENNRGIGTPGPAEIDRLRYAWIGSELALVEHEARVFLKIVFCLSRDVSAVMCGAMNLAVIEDSFAISEDKIDVSGNVTTGKILPRWNAVLSVGSAVAAACIDRVLIAQQAHIVEDASVAGRQQSQGL